MSCGTCNVHAQLKQRANFSHRTVWSLYCNVNSRARYVVCDAKQLQFISSSLGRPARPVFQNAITWATINIFGSGKKHLVALTALYKISTIKTFFGHPQVRDPCPLKSQFKHDYFFKYATWTLLTHCEGGGRSPPGAE